MSTKTTTNTQNQYNQAGMNAYNAFQPQLMSSLLQMAQNPLASSYFQNQLAQQMGMVNQTRQNSLNNVTRNLRAGGGLLSGTGGFSTAMIGRNALAGNLMGANAFNSALNTALGSRNFALGSMEAYQPLQTGQKSTQSQSGLGTWLPQVAGAALNFAAPGIGSMLGGGSFSSGYGGGGGFVRPTFGGGSMGTPQGYMSNPFGTGGGMSTFSPYQPTNPYGMNVNLPY